MFCCKIQALQWQIQVGFYGTPDLKGCFQNYYAQTFYLELRTSALTVAVTHVCQLLYQEFNARMDYVYVYASQV